MAHYDPEHNNGDVVSEAAENAEAQRAQAKQNIKSLTSNPKTRPKVLFTAVMLGVFAVAGILLVGQGDPEDKVSEARIAPPSIGHEEGVTLDAKTTARYNQLEEESNRKEAELAAQTGGSHIDLPKANVQEHAVEEAPLPTAQPVQPTYQAPPPVTVARDTTYDNGMKQQFAAILAGWGGKPVTVKTLAEVRPQTPGSTTPAPPGSGSAGGTGGGSDADKGPTLKIKAGSVYYGINNLEANSDDPGEVMATVQNGPLKGAKILGTFSRGKDTLTLKFNLASPPWPNADSVAINALAIDPEKSQKGIASEVDNHYFLRYGLPLAGAFLQGLGEAAARSATVISTSPLGSTSTQGEIDAGQQLIVAAGRSGQLLANDFNKASSIQPTVKLHANQPIGIVFMQDLKISVPEDVAAALNLP